MTRLKTLSRVCVCVLSLCCTVVFAASEAAVRPTTNTWPQLGELTDTAQIIGDATGLTVAISGNTAVVGSPSEGALAGVAYVFVKPSTGWANMQQTATLTPSDGAIGDDFGDAVAISGNTIVVAAQNLSTVYVFVKPANGWHDMTETAKLTASVATSRFGLGLAISGNTVVVGAYGTNQEGTAYVYVKPTSGWKDMQQTAELLATNKGDFGLAVAISGNTVVVGAPTAFSQTGAVYVYVKPSTGWTDVEPTATLTASDSSAGSNFGGSLSISGNTILSGAFIANNLIGEAYIFVESSTGWKNMTETARLEAPTGAEDFGMSVALGGNTALISAPYSLSSQGVAYIFNKPKNGWVTTSKYNFELKSSDGAPEDLFGASVSLSGQTALIGAFQHNSIRGAAYVFGQ